MGPLHIESVLSDVLAFVDNIYHIRGYSSCHVT